MPQLAEGAILLPSDFADIHNPGYGNHAIIEGEGENSVIKNWIDSRVRLEWLFNTSETGTYKVEGLIKAKANCIVDLGIGEKKAKTEIRQTGENFELVSLGEIQVINSGDQLFTFTPDRENWGEVELKNIRLIK